MIGNKLRQEIKGFNPDERYMEAGFIGSYIIDRRASLYRFLRSQQVMVTAHGCPAPMGPATSVQSRARNQLRHRPTGSNGPVTLHASSLRSRVATRYACAVASCGPQRSKMQMRAARDRAARLLWYPMGRWGSSEEEATRVRTLMWQAQA